MTRKLAARRDKTIRRKPYELRIQIGFLVHDVSRIRRTVFDKAWKPLGITRSQWWLLINLSQQDGTSQRSLAIKMNMSQVSVGESLILLEKSGFVVRTPDMVDRRQKIIFITDEGYELLERSRQISGYLNTAIMRGIPAEDVAVTERTLQRMRENLVELEA